MSNIRYPSPKWFNYAFVAQTLLPMLFPEYRAHIRFINALAGCEEYDKDKYRIIKSTSTAGSGCISEMYNEIRRAPDELQGLFHHGEYDGEFYEKPSPKRFKIALKGNLEFKHEGDDLEYRRQVKYFLEEKDVSHLNENITINEH